jgi:hypothetical protein
LHKTVYIGELATQSVLCKAIIYNSKLLGRVEVVLGN